MSTPVSTLDPDAATGAPPAGASTAPVAAPEPPRAGRGLEIVIVVLLGLVSVTTAWASFQAALYDSAMSASYAQATTASTEAESLYQEALQTLRQDEYVWNRLVELSMEQESSNPELAALAELKFSNLHSTSVSEDLQAAIDWSTTENDANPDDYASPFDSEEYMTTLFSPYSDMNATSTESIAKGDEHNGLSDRLTLNTVLMAVSLFLLGIAAILQRRGTVIALTVISTVIFGLALVLTVTIPVLWV